jgi:hypothetical protein
MFGLFLCTAQVTASRIFSSQRGCTVLFLITIPKFVGTFPYSISVRYMYGLTLSWFFRPCSWQESSSPKKSRFNSFRRTIFPQKRSTANVLIFLDSPRGISMTAAAHTFQFALECISGSESGKKHRMGRSQTPPLRRTSMHFPSLTANPNAQRGPRGRAALALQTDLVSTRAVDNVFSRSSSVYHPNSSRENKPCVLQ